MPIRRGIYTLCVHTYTQETTLVYQSITSNVQKSASEAAAAIGASSYRRNGGPQSGSRCQSSSDGHEGQ